MQTQTSKPARSGLNRVFYAAKYSVQGLTGAYQHERAFKEETWLAAVLVPLAFFVGNTWVEVGLLAGSVLGVLLAELLNSAIEATVDRISLERHELAKRAKDYGSAAVFLALVVCVGLWGSALWAKFC